MEQAWVLALPGFIVLIQLSDSYLRYLPFSEHIVEEERNRLAIGLGALAILSLLAYAWLFEHFGIWTHSYKAVLMASWIPWAAVFMTVVRRDILKHIFVQGMVSVWSFMLHSISAIIMFSVIKDFPEETLLSIHSMIYPILILALLPVERRVFKNLLPPEQFFETRPYGYYIATLPFIVLFSHFFLLADGKLIHSWQEMISRLVLPVSFFFLYRYVLLSGKEFYNHRKEIMNAKRVEEQLSFLEKRYRLALRNQKRISVIRHDLRHNYRILYGLLMDGNLAAARSHIKTQTILLDAIKELPFSKSPLLNAALSVNLWRAERLGIRIHQKIKLPEGRFKAEGDLAILLSELLENAIEETAKVKSECRELSLVLVYDGIHGLLSIENSSSLPVSMGENGLPIGRDGNVGMGMKTLSRFLAQYDGEAAFSCKDGFVKCEISWVDDALSQSFDECEKQLINTQLSDDVAHEERETKRGDSSC